MPVPDPIERGLAKAQSWEDRIKGNNYECSCGSVVPFSSVETTSPDPYAEPFCQNCVMTAKQRMEEYWMKGSENMTALIIELDNDDSLPF